ncbi:cell division cycle protein 20 homolog [Phaenicophaeus curvirostris]|uniref:cell division cycle protein 20 homolog n=1 Tax=Phaenicophaeus curvirostris TaxID=33595 RepID=UPI0037F0A65F
MEHIADYGSSVSWGNGGNFLAVGLSNGEVQLWDIQHQKRLCTMTSHVSRVGCLSWNSHVLSSGACSGCIQLHDVRVAQHHVAMLAGRTQEVCGLKWSPNSCFLTSGGDDHLVNIWPSSQGGRGGFVPVQTFHQHQGAVKAVAWCPWQPSVLATGGGAGDKRLHLWNVCSGICLSNIDAHSQIGSILRSTNYEELISGYGSGENRLVIWKYPAMSKVTELQVCWKRRPWLIEASPVWMQWTSPALSQQDSLQAWVPCLPACRGGCSTLRAGHRDSPGATTGMSATWE